MIASGKNKIDLRETNSVTRGQTQLALSMLEETENENAIQTYWQSFQNSSQSGPCLALLTHFTTISTLPLNTSHTSALNNYLQLPEYDATLSLP